MDSVLAGHLALGIVLSLVLLGAGWRNRSYLREITQDDSRFWRVMAKLTAAAIVAFIVWTSIFDNWRQLTGIPFHAMQIWASARVEYGTPSDDVRTVTYVLLCLALVSSAALFARFVGGYFTQVVVVLLALTCWLPLFIVRQRLGIDLALGFGGDGMTRAEIFGFLGFLAVSWVFDIALILVSYVALTAAVALPVTLLLDISRLRKPRVTGEARSFYDSLGERARTSVRGKVRDPMAEEAIAESDAGWDGAIRRSSTRV